MSGPLLSQVAKSVPFDPTIVGTLTSLNVQDAIDELAAVSAENFSYNFIVVDKTIPTYQQMIVYQACQMDETLTINGELVIIDG